MKPDSTSPNGAGETRRSFLKKTAGIAATAATAGVLKAPVYGQSRAPSANVMGANNRIVVGYIGTGAQGMNHVRQMKSSAEANNIAQGAVCDLYQRRLDQARTTLELSEADACREHERLLERKDIDAVVISTVDNCHARISIDAMEAGKHVFCEIPITRLRPERIFADEIDPEDFSDPARVRNIPRLQKDFLDCIRTGRTPAADIELSIRVQTVLCLAEMAERLSMTLLFDPEKRQITNGEGKVIPAIDFDTPVPVPEPIPSS